jgi:hypothetical protein
MQWHTLSLKRVQENIYCKNIQLPHEEQDNILNSRKILVANCMMEKNHKNCHKNQNCLRKLPNFFYWAIASLKKSKDCHKKSKLPKTYMKNIGISFVKWFPLSQDYLDF